MVWRLCRALDWVHSKLVRTATNLTDHYYCMTPSLEGSVVTLEGAPSDAVLLEPPQGPHPRAWIEVYATAYIDRICQHATHAEFVTRTCKPCIAFSLRELGKVENRRIPTLKDYPVTPKSITATQGLGAASYRARETN
jgi:hypothetical protein